MARRTGSVPLRRVSEVAPFSPTSATPKARTSPWVSFCLLLMVGPTCLPLFQLHFGSKSHKLRKCEQMHILGYIVSEKGEGEEEEEESKWWKAEWKEALVCCRLQL